MNRKSGSQVSNSRSTQVHADTLATSVTYTVMDCKDAELFKTGLYGLCGDKQRASHRCGEWAPTAAKSLFTATGGLLCALARTELFYCGALASNASLT